MRIIKRPSEAKSITEYPNHERASNLYSHWITGYSDEEIAEYFNITQQEVTRDVQHIHALLPVKTVLAHTNDRNRIMLQRAEAAKYRQLLGEALAVPVNQYLESGVNPVGPMKEYREAVGMIAERGPLVNVQQNTNIFGEPRQNGISSAEELMRRVMTELDEPAPVATVIDAQTVPAEAIPDPDEAESAER